MKKPTTIHDIAKAAQVSSATVSRVMSNSGYPVSKQLKENKSRTIGVIIPTIINPFYSSVIFGSKRSQGRKILVVACNSLHDPTLSKSNTESRHPKYIWHQLAEDRDAQSKAPGDGRGRANGVSIG